VPLHILFFHELFFCWGFFFFFSGPAGCLGMADTSPDLLRSRVLARHRPARVRGVSHAAGVARQGMLPKGDSAVGPVFFHRSRIIAAPALGGFVRRLGLICLLLVMGMLAARGLASTARSSSNGPVMEKRPTDARRVVCEGRLVRRNTAILARSRSICRRAVGGCDGADADLWPRKFYTPDPGGWACCAASRQFGP